MPPEGQLDSILRAAYTCFTRHGVARTTMEDLARAADMSRPAVYQYVRNKEDAYRRLADRLYTDALDQARTALAADGPLADRLAGALQAKLSLTLGLYRDSPHAAELVGDSARIAVDESHAFTTAMTRMLAETVNEGRPHAAPDEVDRFVAVLLALTRGLEADPSGPDEPIRRLREGVALLVAGLESHPNDPKETS